MPKTNDALKILRHMTAEDAEMEELIKEASLNAKCRTCTTDLPCSKPSSNLPLALGQSSQ